MVVRIFILISFLFISCSKEEVVYIPTEKIDPYVIYKEGYEALEKGKRKGAKIKNGLEMLHLQAELSWNYWNQK